MANVNLAYFLEDLKHLQIIPELVKRIAEEEGFSPVMISHDVRNAQGGSKAIKVLKGYIRDLKRERAKHYDLLIIGWDANCYGYNVQKRKLEKIIPNMPQIACSCFAIPNPHIERWLILDQKAFSNVVGITAPQIPSSKCDRDYYKNLINQAFRKEGLSPNIGGFQYASDIVREMDLDLACNRENNFKKFHDGIKDFFKKVKAESAKGC